MEERAGERRYSSDQFLAGKLLARTGGEKDLLKGHEKSCEGLLSPALSSSEEERECRGSVRMHPAISVAG
jgi:hypothetical protein